MRSVVKYEKGGREERSPLKEGGGRGGDRGVLFSPTMRGLSQEIRRGVAP